MHAEKCTPSFVFVTAIPAIYLCFSLRPALTQPRSAAFADVKKKEKKKAKAFARCLTILRSDKDTLGSGLSLFLILRVNSHPVRERHFVIREFAWTRKLAGNLDVLASIAKATSEYNITEAPLDRLTTSGCPQASKGDSIQAS